MATFETSEGPPAVVALLGAGGAVERATTRFVERYGAKPAWLGSHHSEVERVLAGELDDLTVEHDGVAVNLSSVVASTGQRYALLTVSDIDNFAERGGMIGFTTQENKVKLVINPKAATAAGMRIDAQLLEIASRVIEK